MVAIWRRRKTLSALVQRLLTGSRHFHPSRPIDPPFADLTVRVEQHRHRYHRDD
jgi:hypothetical protein